MPDIVVSKVARNTCYDKIKAKTIQKDPYPLTIYINRL